MQPVTVLPNEIADRAEQIYEERIRAMVDSKENEGKLVAIDVVSGDYEMDRDEIELARRMKQKHPQGALYMMRVGYDAVHSLGGRLRRDKQ